jgi:hypothetical protein
LVFGLRLGQPPLLLQSKSRLKAAGHLSVRTPH